LSAKPVDSGLLDYIKLYEKAILLLIGFVITGVLSFCFGVEKGKTLAASGSNSRFDAADNRRQNPAPLAALNNDARASVKPVAPNIDGSFSVNGRMKDLPVKQEIILQPQQAGKDCYTIQIATYQAKDGAEREMAKLRRNGLSPLVIKKGAYSVVCVGNFNNKETAKSLLTKLRSKYRDCYIRRL